jgi:NADPH-dependent 2,4-dienoyl-CoA reductase/sulfur reductase-like enzyme
MSAAAAARVSPAAGPSHARVAALPARPPLAWHRLAAPRVRVRHPHLLPSTAPAASTSASSAEPALRPTPAAERASPDVEWDAVVVGAGFGGLAAATQLAAAGAKVAVLER